MEWNGMEERITIILSTRTGCVVLVVVSSVFVCLEGLAFGIPTGKFVFDRIGRVHATSLLAIPFLLLTAIQRQNLGRSEQPHLPSPSQHIPPFLPRDPIAANFRSTLKVVATLIDVNI